MALAVTHLIGFGGKKFLPPYIVDISGTHDAADEDASSATAGWSFSTDGTVDILEGSSIYDHDWATPAGSPHIGFYYEIRATKNSGSDPDGSAVGSWLSTFVQWTVSQTGVGVTLCSLNIEIRDANSQVVLSSGTYTMSASVSP